MFRNFRFLLFPRPIAAVFAASVPIVHQCARSVAKRFLPIPVSEKKKKTPVHSMRASEIEQWEKAGGCKKVKRNNATTGGEADRPSLEGAERQLDK